MDLLRSHWPSSSSSPISDRPPLESLIWGDCFFFASFFACRVDNFQSSCVRLVLQTTSPLQLQERRRGWPGFRITSVGFLDGRARQLRASSSTTSELLRAMLVDRLLQPPDPLQLPASLNETSQTSMSLFKMQLKTSSKYSALSIHLPVGLRQVCASSAPRPSLVAGQALPASTLGFCAARAAVARPRRPLCRFLSPEEALIPVPLEWRSH